MSTPNTVRTVEVSYEPPHQRAMASATRTGTSTLLALALAAVVLPLLGKFFADATYTHATFVALMSGIGVAVCATLTTYVLAFAHAAASDPVYQERRTAARPRTPDADTMAAAFLAAFAQYQADHPAVAPPPVVPPGVPPGSGSLT